jgi:signal transduction histidine kinase
MNQSGWKKNFFLLIKMIYLLIVLVGTVIKRENGATFQTFYLLFSACFFASSVFYELVPHTYRWIALLGEGISVFVSLLTGFDSAIYFGPVVLLDLIVLAGLPVYCCLFNFLVGAAFAKRLPADPFKLIVASIALGVIYYQQYGIIAGYQREIRENNDQESRLKENMKSAKHRHEMQMKQSRLEYENQMLTQKAEISQALHDKLGHNVNGSIYQLEACKAIMDTQPDQSKAILQMVIEHLRGSMDEIRLILRRERPRKGQMSIIQLQSLCEDCKEKYQIEAELTITGEESRINDTLWEVILDNTYEAVSNALKYADCRKIKIQLLILNEIVRCTIQDDGKGCSSIVEGMGLTGMKQRVRAVRGVFDVESNQGFKINMILPLEKTKG